MPKFPKLIYVRWEETGGDEEPFMCAATTPEAEDGEKVAIYTLKEIKTKKVVESLV